MYGKNCSTGICLEPEAKGCGTTLKFTQCGSILRWYQISCAGCTKTIACNKCLLYQGSAMKDTEECIGTTCNDVQTLNVSVATCPNKLDYYGNTCQCCYSLNNQNLTKTGKCSNEFELFNQSDFVAYAQKVYEMSLCVGLALVGIVGLMV